jgi:uncharacterized protein YukE
MGLSGSGSSVGRRGLWHEGVVMAVTRSDSAQGFQDASDWITAAERNLDSMRLQFERIRAGRINRCTGELPSAFQGALVQWVTNYNEIIMALQRVRRSMGAAGSAGDPNAE